MIMKTLRILLSILFLLGTAAHAFPEIIKLHAWKTGKITDIKKKLIELDGKLYLVSDSVVIMTLDKSVLGSDLELLRSVESILFTEKNGKIDLIRIDQSMQ